MARESLVASLLGLVAMREQVSSAKLLAFEEQLEDQEVAVLELERQVSVLELGENFKRLSDLVDEIGKLQLESSWRWWSLEKSSSDSQSW